MADNRTTEFDADTYELEQAAAIEAWKEKSPDVISRSLGILLQPLAVLTQLTIVTGSVRRVLDMSNEAAARFADEGDIRRQANVTDIAQLRQAPLRDCDHCADSVHNWSLGFAAAQGGVTGAFGLLGIAANIPILITLALRTIHKTGLCYGYRLETTQERQFALGILAASGSNDVKEKEAALSTLRSLQTLVAEKNLEEMEREAARQIFTRQSAVIAVRNLARQLGVNLTERKMLQMLPVVGALVGASADTWYLNNVAHGAKRVFQERWLRENGKMPVRVNATYVESPRN